MTALVTDFCKGFIGALYVNKENMALGLVKEGLARVSDYLDRVPFANELLAAQEQAQKEQRNVRSQENANFQTLSLISFTDLARL